MNIVILNYQMGNIHSVYKRLSNLDCKLKVSESPNDLNNADKIILPGVGHFSKAMEQLKRLEYLDILNEKVLVKQTPILGICLGMQVMCKKSEEGNTEGLGWFDADITKFKVSDKLRYKVPHTGWNDVLITKDHPIITNIPKETAFYFVHSYHVSNHQDDDVLGVTNYEKDFVSAIAKEHIVGMQFHPEKSHDVGQRIFENFVNL